MKCFSCLERGPSTYPEFGISRRWVRETITLASGSPHAVKEHERSGTFSSLSRKHDDISMLASMCLEQVIICSASWGLQEHMQQMYGGARRRSTRWSERGLLEGPVVSACGATPPRLDETRCQKFCSLQASRHPCAMVAKLAPRAEKSKVWSNHEVTWSPTTTSPSASHDAVHH